ncbi:MAG TPA: hypothetical protein VNZ58_08985, partial [Thermomicrobiales bacterium]|nr:hypothetical protein [Thermomicrobiales bacterium]
ADHVRHGYPGYGSGDVDNAVTAYLVILAILGALGLAGWLATLWSVRTGKRWSRWLATVAFVGAVTVALSALTIRDTSGEVGLAPLFGWLLVLPLVPGVIVVWRMWRMAE